MGRGRKVQEAFSEKVTFELGTKREIEMKKSRGIRECLRQSLIPGGTEMESL